MMSNLYEAHVQGAKDYVSGEKECKYSHYDEEEVAEWRVGWTTESQLHFLSSSKKELEEKLEEVRNILKRLKIEVDEELERYKSLKDLIKAVVCSLGSIISRPPILKRNVLKRIKAILKNILELNSFKEGKILEDHLESSESEETLNAGYLRFPRKK